MFRAPKKKKEVNYVRSITFNRFETKTYVLPRNAFASNARGTCSGVGHSSVGRYLMVFTLFLDLRIPYRVIPKMSRVMCFSSWKINLPQRYFSFFRQHQTIPNPPPRRAVANNVCFFIYENKIVFNPNDTTLYTRRTTTVRRIAVLVHPPAQHSSWTLVRQASQVEISETDRGLCETDDAVRRYNSSN